MKLAGKLNVDTSRFSCSNYTHVHPYRGVAALKAGDVGTPEAIVFRKGSAVPYELSIKRVGDEEWTKFFPKKHGFLNEQNNLSVHADPQPAKHLLKYDDLFPSVEKARKLYGIEYPKAFVLARNLR